MCSISTSRKNFKQNLYQTTLLQGSVFPVNQMETFCATQSSDNSMTTRARNVSCTFKLR